MNRSMCSDRVAAGPRALLTRARSARRAAPQRTRVRTEVSLRFMEAVAELISVLPPEGAPVLQKLVKAVKEDVEEAQQQRQQAEQKKDEAQQKKDEAVAVMIKEKDEKMVLADKLHQQEKLLAQAMYSAGVRGGLSCMEYLEDLKGIKKEQRVQGWTEVLTQKPGLIKCMAKAAPSWGVDVKDSKAAGKLARKIAGMFNVLDDRIHTFIPGLGLVVYTGVPNSPTSEALVCLAEAFGVPCKRHQSISP